MTVTSPSTADTVPTDLVTLTIDGFEVAVPKGTLVIRAAELLGIQIPRFCDHPLLDPVGACRQCIVEVEGQRKPLASCTTTVTEGMVVKTQLTSPVAKKAQEGTLELLLINHPLDCPVYAAYRFTQFYAHESCGKCTPCREGTYWMVQILQRLEAGSATEDDSATLLDTCDNIFGRSFCALGDGATSPIVSGVQYFRDEFLAHVTQQGCPFDPHASTVFATASGASMTAGAGR